MIWKKHAYEDIAGTYVFDGQTAHAAYALNKLLFSFNREENRREFGQDPDAYVAQFDLTVKQKEALLKGDYLGLIRLGANIYYLAKLTVPKGISIQDVGAAFQGITTDQFKAKLLRKGEKLAEKLKAQGGYWNG